MIMYRTVAAIPLQITGQSSNTGVHENSGNLLMEHSFVLHDNPFMNMYGSRMGPIYQAAVGAYLDCFAYRILGDAAVTPEAKADMLTKQIGCKMVVHELALCALLCEKGFSEYRDKSKQLRIDLMDIADLL
jgi:hypothetical protein